MVNQQQKSIQYCKMFAHLYMLTGIFRDNAQGDQSLIDFKREII